MKTKLLITILCACALCKVQAQEWGYDNTLTEKEWMCNIWTQGLDTVYIVGKNGLIARSVDQGKTWEKQYFPSSTTLYDIIFTDCCTGFAVGEQGTILKTTDAGETWKQISLNITSRINAVAANGQENIWAVGDNSLVLHSTDAGETWVQENILPENDRKLTDIAFRGNLGYFTGNYAMVYKTEDSGTTWNKQTEIGELKSPDIYEYAHFVNIMENKTYLVAGDTLYSTEDQVNWISMYKADLLEVDLFFLNDSVGYTSVAALFTGNHGVLVIQKTTTGGKSWEAIKEQLELRDIASYPSKIKMVNDTLGYAVFTQVLLKTPPDIINFDRIGKINKAKTFTVRIADEELILKSESDPIQSMEVYDILGKKLIHKQWQNPVWEAHADISRFPENIYLIKIMYGDGTISIEKHLIR
jgi:photosystem II stability/assembly factor-like uncharacterized protein